MTDTTQIDTTSSTVDSIFHYRVTDQARYQQYLDEVFPVTEGEEPYVLEYKIFRGSDGTMFQHERYENEDAVVKHMTRTASAQEDFAASTEFISLTMLGALSESIREAYGINTEFTPFRSVER